MFPASRTWSVSQHPWERTHQEAGGVWTSVLGPGEGSSGGPAAPVLRRVLACPCSCSSVINRSQAAPWPENHGCHQATRCPSSDSKSSPCTCASSHVPPQPGVGGGAGDLLSTSAEQEAAKGFCRRVASGRTRTSGFCSLRGLWETDPSQGTTGGVGSPVFTWGARGNQSNCTVCHFCDSC